MTYVDKVKLTGAMTDYLSAIDQIGVKTREEIDKILASVTKGGIDISKVPISTSNLQVTLSPQGQLENYIKQQEDAFRATDRLKHGIEDVLLRTGTAAQGAKVFFQQYADYALNTAQVVHDAFAKVFGALEDQLTNLLANFKFDFKSLFDTIKESVARAVVQRFILGPIASALGLTKKDGSTEANALWVKLAGVGGISIPGIPQTSESSGAPTDIMSKLQGQIGKIFSSIGGFFSQIGTIIHSIFSSIVGAIGGLFKGGFASGGFLPAGKWGIAGELGPEPIYGGRSGLSIIPNHVAFGRLGGNVYNQTINQYLTPTKSDPYGYSPSQIANATFNGLARAGARS